MTRRLISMICAAAVALTAALPTQAFALTDQERTARTLAAILGLAVVGGIIVNNRNDRKDDRYAKPPTHRIPPVYHVEPRPLPDRASRKLLPRQCLRRVETRGADLRFFGQRCLKRNYDFARHLPGACRYLYHTRNGERRGYDARCLRERGFRMARS